MKVKDIINKKKKKNKQKRRSLKLENECLTKELNKALLELIDYKNEEINEGNTIKKKLLKLEKRIKDLEEINADKKQQRVNKSSGG